MKGRVAAFLQEARASTIYRDLFPKAFPAETNSFTLANIAKALAAFERTIISAGSPYDRFHGGDETAISDAASAARLCFLAIRSRAASDVTEDPTSATGQAHNTGLYNLPAHSSYPPSNLGIFEKTRRRADRREIQGRQRYATSR
jgi:cytochrome c peroxidase